MHQIKKKLYHKTCLKLIEPLEQTCSLVGLVISRSSLPVHSISKILVLRQSVSSLLSTLLDESASLFFICFLFGYAYFWHSRIASSKIVTGVFCSGLMRLFQVRIHPISLFKLAFLKIFSFFLSVLQCMSIIDVNMVTCCST